MKTSFVQDDVECYISVISEIFTASVFRIAATGARIWSGNRGNSHDIRAKYLQYNPSNAEEKTSRIKQIISKLQARSHAIAAR
jgi:hypothetical protein